MSLANKQFSVIQIRRGLESDFIITNILLASGEPAYTTDTKLFKIGDGITPWNDLSTPYISGSHLNNITISDGFIKINNIPTDDPDVTGVIWSHNGTLKISGY